MANISREQIFAQAARKLRAEFDELSVVPHNALKGHEAEEIIRRFLNAHIPKRFAVGSGFILDPKGQISRQTDVVIYDAFNCPVYRASEDASIFPSNNVAAVVEVKSTLDKKELEDAWEKIDAIKGLAKVSHMELGPERAQTAGFLFAFDSKISLTTLVDHYRDLFRRNGIGRHIDVIAVLNKGIVTLAAQVRGLSTWNLAFIDGLGGEQGEGSHIAISASQLEEYTLDGFFRLLLPHLALFRGLVDHPGLRFDDMPIRHKQQLLAYLTSVTTEKNPELREKKLREYAQQVRDQFSRNPAPQNWEAPPQ